MGFLVGLKQRAKALKKQLVVVYYASRDPRVPLPPKLLVTFALLYALSPLDLIPDFIPILGYLDDLILLPALLTLALKLIPPEVLRDAVVRAENEPPSLKKNWGVGFVIVAIWVSLVVLVIRGLWNLASPQR